MLVIRAPLSYKRLAFWFIAFVCAVWIFHHPVREYGRALLGQQYGSGETVPQDIPGREKAEDTKETEVPNNNDNLQPQLEKDKGEVASKEDKDYNLGAPRSRIPEYLQRILSWNPPVHVTDHYPPYDQYDQRDFDPNRWEGFEQNNDIYLNGTLNNLGAGTHMPIPYLPYPNYNGKIWSEEWQGRYVSCEGPSGKNFNESDKDMMRAYRGWPKGFPEPSVGSFDAVGLDKYTCFDRHSRLDVYGLDLDFGQTEDSGEISEATLRGARQSDTDFTRVDWGRLQRECLQRNANRFSDPSEPNMRPGLAMEHAVDAQIPNEKRQTGVVPSQKQTKSRTAILIRTWDSYEYRKNDVQAVRSLISELALLSGGEYSVFLLVNIKDLEDNIYDDEALYEQRLQQYVPEELRSIAVLWTERICQQWYPKVGEWSVYYQQFMPLQWFSKTHPEFDYFWNWEMDARLIGHHYHFLDQMQKFAAEQPRKYLWERNSRYYFPAVHGTYEQFVEDTNRIVAGNKALKTVWGPEVWSDLQNPVGPTPPTSEAEDNFQWGVGEEADFITLLPLWDPRDTLWAYRDKLFNYPQVSNPVENKLFPQIPRRVFINTLARFSKGLLSTMHEENQWGLGMASEMWPGSIALHHGLKAVYAPHPIWTSHNWPSEYLDSVFNADGWGAGSLTGGDVDQGRGAGFDVAKAERGLPQTGSGPNKEGKPGRWSQEADCAYSPDREHNFGGWSWYFWSDFSKVLYRRWLGWNAAFGFVTSEGTRTDDQLGEVEWSEYEKQHSRMCLPTMLLHPIKNVTLFDSERVR